MHLLSLFDWTQFCPHWLAQTPDSTKLLEQQFELLRTLREENRSLSESFKSYITAMQFVLVVFGVLGSLIAYIFAQNLKDAKQVAREMINQEVNRRIVETVDAEMSHVKRSIGRERVISDILVDYYYPVENFHLRELNMLRTRGFKQVRSYHAEFQLRQSPGDVVVMDLGRWPEANGQTFDELKEAADRLSEDDKKKENRKLDQIALERVRQVLNLLPQTTALVVYVRASVYSLNSLKGGDRHVGIANMPITLVGMVADAAYVVYEEQGRMN